MMKRIAVIGSLNVDLVSRVPRFLLPGETLEGLDFHIYTGGKGGNQAVASSRLAKGVMMLAKLGDDANGALYRKVFLENGIDDTCVETVKGVNTGMGIGEVDASSGNNRFVNVPGTNKLVDIAQVDRHWEKLMAYDIFLLQLEIPMETVDYAIRRLHGAGKTVMLDPAPATMPVAAETLRCVDYLTPNEVELGTLAGMETGSTDKLMEAALALHQKGVKTIVVKAGKRGAFLARGGSVRHFPAFVVEAVDTTAAGDSFNAGLASALSKGMEVEEAIKYANAAGALSTLKTGAQSALPDWEQVEAFISEREGSRGA